MMGVAVLLLLALTVFSIGLIEVLSEKIKACVI